MKHLFILLVCALTQVQLYASPLINKRLDESLLETLVSIAEESSIDQTLELIKREFPKLKIIVLDLDIAVKEIRGPLITWRDKEIGQDELQVYHDYLKTRIQTVGLHIAKDTLVRAVPNRPLMNHPLIIIKNRSPKHAILHEVMHLLIDLSDKGERMTLPLDESSSDQLDKIFNGAGEEVYVDTYLLSNRDKLMLSKKDLCLRAKYLNQNLQLLNYFISELDESVGNVTDHKQALKSEYILSKRVLDRNLSSCY